MAFSFNTILADSQAMKAGARIFLRTVLLSLALGIVERGDARTRPNIVFLLTDDQRWDTLHATGNQIIRTPNLDRLCADGVTFDNAFVTTAICMTSRASIFTGQYAAHHRVWRFDTDFTPDQLANAYPGILKAAGYRIGFVGKWGVGNPPKDFFDYSRAFPGQGVYFHEVDGKKQHLTSMMGDQAIEFLESSKPDQPFCLSVSFKAPHVQDTPNVHAQAFPFDPKFASLYENDHIPVPETADSRYFDRLPPFLQNSEARARWAVRFWGPERYQFSVKSYYRLITGADDVVGRIRDQLKKMGVDQNTVIIFSSDHGFYLGEFGLAGKWFPNDVCLRVPMIIMDPRLPKDRHCTHRDEMVLNIDLAPTILDAADLEATNRMQGRSMMPLARGESPIWRNEYFYEHLFDHPGLAKSEAVRTERWKYIRYVETQPVYEQLFDLKRDPNETQNLAGEPAYKDVLKDLRSRYQNVRTAAYSK